MNRFLRIDPLIFLSTTILFYILRMVAPNVNYLFLPLLFLFLAFSIWHLFKENYFKVFKQIIKYNIPLLIICILIIWGNVVSSEMIFASVKEALNTFIVFFLAFNFFIFIKTRESFEKFTSIFSNQLLVLSIVTAIMGIIKNILQLIGIEIPRVLSANQIGTSLNADYNFYVLFSFLGIISLIYYRSKIGLARFYLFLSILLINIVFSGSRRGIIFMLILCLLFYLFGTNFRLEIKKVAIKFVILVTLFAFLLFSYNKSRNTHSIIRKNQSTDLLQTSQAQNNLTRIGYRYFTIINSKKSIYEFYMDLWDRSRPKDKDGIKNQYPKKDDDNLIYNGDFKLGLTYWFPMSDKVQHEIIQTPYGKGVRVSRYNGDNSGWPLQYKGRDILFYSGHTYFINYKFKIINGEEIPFKIGFKVDDPILGNGKASNLYPIIVNLENGWKQGSCYFTFWKSCSNTPFFMNSQLNSTIVEFADIRLRDANPVDTIPIYSDQISLENNEIQNYLNHYDSIFYSKRSEPEEKNNLFYNSDFHLGTLYWLPAASATEHSVIETPYGKGLKVTRKKGDHSYWSLLYNGRPIIYYAGHTYKLSFLFKVIKGSGIPFYVGWQAEDGFRGYPSYSIPREITKLENGWNEIVFFDKFKNTHYDLPAFLNSLKDSTEIDIAKVKLIDIDRKEAQPKFVDELYEKSVKILAIPDKSLVGTSLQPSFSSSRIDRWKYAVDLYINNFTLRQKIIGGGFDYLLLFGKKFGETKYDYPHNPFLDTFLFSGIFGGLFYIFYFILVVYYYLKNYKRHKFFFFCFIIVFVFSFVSANTHFSVPVFAILCIIPFLTKYIVEKEKNEIELQAKSQDLIS
jgi:hypothetical protein